MADKVKMAEPERYKIKVGCAEEFGHALVIDINGEKHQAEEFEFEAPFGAGFKVNRITRIVLE